MKLNIKAGAILLLAILFAITSGTGTYYYQLCKVQSTVIATYKQDNAILVELSESLIEYTASENEKHSFQVLKKQVWNKDKQLPSGKEYRGKIRSVQSFTLENILIKTYFNPTEAEQDGFNLKQISAVCCGNQKTHKGLLWKYLDT